MIRIPCPFCGERDHSEFTYGGDGSIVYPELDGSMEDWHEAVFQRENIRGVQVETWHHASGCRMWLLVERDTMTHEILSVRPAHEGMQAAIEVGK
ncbi:MAG: sarcosine oxidase subunit delta [Pseudomonadota bacterium]